MSERPIPDSPRPTSEEADPLPPSTFSPEVAKSIDRMFDANIAKLTGGIDPRVLPLAFLDWWIRLAWSPGKQARLAEKAIRKVARTSLFVTQAQGKGAPPPAIEPLPQDSRFRAQVWEDWPYNVMSQSFLLTQQWWANATTGVPGMSKAHENIVTFVTRQLLDLVSPANFPLANPEVRDATIREGGANLLRGWANFWDDWARLVSGQPPAGTENFLPGKDVAVTPGKVVYRNHLIELIQYAPSTGQVYSEPVLIVPAWIMKYYILDLSPDNSLVKYLVDKGHTVFMVSWRNPTSADRELGMEDYRRLGIMAALEAISVIVPKRQVNGVGYCLGGTLLTIAAAAMARDGDDRLRTVSLLAAQTDFTEAGELMLFVNEAQVNFLESMMWDRGLLDSYQMSGAFQLLRSNDLIWSRMVRDYLLGSRREPNDLMAWNADQTRMPYRMHKEYLRKLFLNNDLATGRYEVEGRPIAISDIHVPLCAIATEKDHVAPWHSVYKINLLANSQEVAFLLTTGGHNAGIVSEPGHPRRRFRMSTRLSGNAYVDPKTWQESTPEQEGSWWPAWEAWLAGHSVDRCAPPGLGMHQSDYSAVCDAPGTYVFQK